MFKGKAGGAPAAQKKPKHVKAAVLNPKLVKTHVRDFFQNKSCTHVSIVS